MVRLGGIKAEEAKNHPDKNIITRAMGVKEEVEADIYEYRLKKGDMILMCTDGLSNMVEDEDMFDIVKGAERHRRGSTDVDRKSKQQWRER